MTEIEKSLLGLVKDLWIANKTLSAAGEAIAIINQKLEIENAALREELKQ